MNVINSDDFIVIEGKISVLAAIEGKKREINTIFVKNSANMDNIGTVIRKAEREKIKIETIEEDQFENLISGKTHGGIGASVSKRKYPDFNEFMQSISIDINQNYSSIAIIEGVEDPFNYGYTIRSLYTLGINGMAVIKRDWGFAEPILLKSSTGTFDFLPIYEMEKDEKLGFITKLKHLGYKIYCIDKNKDAQSIYNTKFEQKSVVVFGGEKRGISKEFINSADCFVEIPYSKPFKYSLTIQAASTIVAYELKRNFMR